MQVTYMTSVINAIMRPHCLLVLIALVTPLTIAATGGESPPVGGYKPIKNISDPEVKEVAEFAVSEYNKQPQGKNKLVFESVIRGEIQTVAGTSFRLIISAKNESLSTPMATAEDDDYEAVVWDKPWEHFRKLISFQQLEKSN